MPRPVVGARPLLLGGLTVLLLVGAAAPPTGAEQLPIKTFTTADGLANDHIDCIVQDRHGFLWFCTGEGLSRFDGYDFKTIGREHGLPSPEVLDFLETGDGEYWVATDRGLCRFDASSSRCAEQALGDAASGLRAQALLKDASGRLWVATTRGLFRSGGEPRNGTFRAVALGTTLDTRVFALAESTDGSMWAGATGGVWRVLPDGRAAFHAVGSRLAPERAVSLHADARGRIWIGHMGDRAGVTVFAFRRADLLPPGALPAVTATEAPPVCPADLSRLAPEKACIVTQPPYSSQGVTGFSGSSDGTLWATTLNAGLLHLEERGVRRYTTGQGLRTNSLRGSVLEDRSGDLWIGTETQGVMRWTRRGLVSYREADGLPATTRVRSVFTDARGEVYASSTRSFLSRFDGRGFEAVQVSLGPFSTGDFSFGAPMALRDRMGDWWIASSRGLLRFAGAGRLRDLAWARPTAAFLPGLPADSVGPVFEDSRGDVWAGAECHRLLRWRRETGALQSYALPDALPRPCSLTSFAEDRTGALWVGLGLAGGAFWRSADPGGLVRMRNDRPEAVVLEDGTRALDIRWLHVDQQGRLWFAAGRGGLGRLDDPAAARPRAVRYGRGDGLSSEMVHSLTEDRWGRIYAGTDLGVDRLDAATGRIEHFGVADGLVGTDIRTAARDASGRLWFGTQSGLSTLLPEQEPLVALPPVRITSLRVGGVEHPLPGLGARTLGGLELGTEDSPVEIAFAGVAPAPYWKRQYRFRLEGADRDWSAPGERHEVNYTRLPPGAYRFLVQAWSADGGAGPPPASVEFRVLPPFWRRWWFLSAVGVTALLLAYAAVRYRLRMLLEVERVRTGIATDLHDDIGASLSQIAILSELARRREEDTAGAATLASIADVSRGLVDSMSDIVWAINPARDSLRDLAQRMRAFAGEVFGALDVALRFTASPAGEELLLAAGVRRQVFLVFKEAVNNAASHSECANARVELNVHDGVIVMTVADDGRGMPAGADHDGHGLASMAGRARGLGGTLEVRSEPGRGTSVTLRAPMRPGRRPRVRPARSGSDAGGRPS